MKKLSNKGFTLIELLATILIIGLVLGLTTYGIISSVKSAKVEGSKLTLAGIKEAARTYSNEYTDDTWKASNKLNNIYFCTTIQELINKGLLDKNAKNVEGNTIGLNDYIAVVKDKTTKVIKKEFVLTLQAFNEDEEKNEAHQYCTGNIKPEDIKKLPIINKKNTYTDTIIAEFTDAEFKTKDGNVSNIKKRECLYDETTSGNFTSEGTITNKECKIEGLVQNKNYYVKVCMTSKNDSRACSTPEIVKTKEVKSPSININTNDSIKITYDDTNIIAAKGEHYFKSDVNATSNKNVKKCTLSTITNNCDKETKEISINSWYKVSDKEVILSYTNSGDITINAKTMDKSGNYKSTDKNYSLYKIIFSKGTADKIGGQTTDIKKLCLADRIADRNKSCSITSPNIEKAGYSVVGWNTNSSATTSSWNVNISRSINKSETYYPITKLSTYTITYNNNNGSGCTSKTVNYNSQIGTLCTPKRKGYTFIGWYNSDYKDKPLNYYADTNPDLYNAFNYDADKLYNHYLTYGVNEGRRVAQYLSSDTYNYTKNITVYAGWKVNKIKIKYNVNGGQLNTNNSAYSTSGSYVTLNGSTIIEAYNYGDMLGSDGLYNYNNPAYINIVRSGYKAVSGKEWYNDAKNTFNQATRYDVNDLCDASNSDCEVTLYVNWIKEDSINDYRCSGSDYYYITTCDTNSCNYTIKNGSNTSGTVIRNNLRHCNKITFYANGGSFSNGTTSFFFMATPGVRYSFNSSYYIEGIGMPTVSKSGCSLSGWYYYPESKVIYSWFDVNSDEYNVELKANWYCPSSGGGTGGNLGNGCPSSTPNRLTKGSTVYCCSLGVTDPGNPGAGKSCIAIYEGNAGTVPACGYCTSSTECRSMNSCGASCVNNQCRVYLTKPNGSCLGVYDSCN